MSRMTDQIGRVLSGRYRLIAPIGTGASAQVYLADDVRLEEPGGLPRSEGKYKRVYDLRNR